MGCEEWCEARSVGGGESADAFVEKFCETVERRVRGGKKWRVGVANDREIGELGCDRGCGEQRDADVVIESRDGVDAER